MRLNSITFKIVSLAILLFIFTSATVLVVVDYRMRSITDDSQERIYVEKIDLILSRLKNYDKRLEQTGLEDVYLADFQQLALTRLNDNYYKNIQSRTYPVIINTAGNLLLTKEQEVGESLFNVFADVAAGEVNAVVNTYFDYAGVKYWGVYKYFPEWKWYVAYVVPLDVKYAQSKTLTNSLALIMVGAVLLLLILLIIFLTRVTRPIVHLTEVAGKISEGDLDQEIVVETRDEVGRLARAFDKMRISIMDQLEELNSEVAERKQAESNLLVTLNSIGDAVISTNRYGKIVHMNPVALELTGWELDDAIGKPLLDVFNIVSKDANKKCANPVEQVLDTGEIVSFASKTVLISKDGSEYSVADSGAPIRDDAGEIIGVVLVFRDVTEQYKLEEKVRQSDKMQAVGQLAGGIAHDFNNMLGGIIGATEILHGHLDDSSQAEELYSIVVNAADRAAELTQQLLAFARSKKIASTSVELHQVVEDSVSLLKRTIDRSIKIEVELDAESDTLIGDPAQLQNIIINLSINASHAMPDGGTLSLKTKEVFLDDNYCENSDFELESGRYIELEVRDNGSGIAAESLPRIFEPFFTTKKEGKGTGLGLSAVYGSVQQHHGAITIYSELGEGTVFYISLPLSGAKQNFCALPEQEVAFAGEGTILVVDDEAIMRATAEAILEDAGYAVMLAENGKEGFDIYREHKDEIRLVILDMIMPVMNGQDCFEKIMEISPDAKVILASGFSKDEDIERMKRRDLSAFISKPYRSIELTEVIAEVLQGNHSV